MVLLSIFFKNLVCIPTIVYLSLHINIPNTTGVRAKKVEEEKRLKQQWIQDHEEKQRRAQQKAFEIMRDNEVRSSSLTSKQICS